MAERVKATFPGSDDPVSPIKEERLIPATDEDDEELDEKPPEYKREHIAARVGEPLEASQAASAVEEQLNHDDVVPMIFSKKVQLQDKGIMHIWGVGVHLVPISLAGRTPKEAHWWLRHNKVRRAGKAMPSPTAEEKTGSEAAED